MTERRPPICVTGMGRSGTSLTTELIGRLGLDLGPTDRMLPPVAQDNARGYWEQAAIHDLNEEILGAFGGTWERPPKLEPGWEDDAAIAPLRRRAAVLLLELFGPAPERFAVKDPRLAVTLPFWRSLIGRLDHVICIRHPADVAASLGRRAHDFSDAYGVELWVHYTRAALANTAGERRLLLHYESYFDDTESQITRLAEFVLGREAAADPALHAALRDCIEPELWHNREGSRQLGEVVAASLEATQIYAAVEREAGAGFDRDVAGARAAR